MSTTPEAVKPNQTEAPRFSGLLPFVVWRRRSRRRWAPVLDGQSEKDCWAKLLALMSADGPGEHWDNLILPKGSEP